MILWTIQTQKLAIVNWKLSYNMRISWQWRFANCIKSTKFIQFLFSKLNVKTFSQWLKPDPCQTHQHKTDHTTPDSCQTQTPPDPTIGTTIASFAFLATRLATVRTYFQFFPHRTNGTLIQSSVTCCYIRSRLLFLFCCHYCLRHCLRLLYTSYMF
jgi:hypothetical protein